jgi:nicotinamide-nucleotide amidase
MKADIIAIGDEILIGQITDTNSGFMAKYLNDLGIEVNRITVISDSKEHIIKTLEDSLKHSDIVLITGGLGPTNDDITKFTLAEYFNSELIHSEEVLNNIKQIFAGREITLNKQNLGQALVPNNCTVLNNRMGTAPGMFFKVGNKMVFSMPGVPFEMKALFKEQIIPIIEKNNGNSLIANKTVFVYHIPESILAERLEEWEAAFPVNMSLAYLPSPGLVKLRITARGDNKEILLSKIDDKIDLLANYIAIDSLETISLRLEERLNKLAIERNVSIASAESCTGGLIAHLITSVPGSSAFFKGGVISYSNEIKENILKVNADDLLKSGAVSEIVVEQMAEGARHLLNTDYVVSTSGIAGPDGGTLEKPVGTVWIAVASKDKTISTCFNFSNNRDRNIEKSANMAIDMLYKEIKENV